MTSLACVDLFCGAGGLTHGLISEGIPVVAGVDIDRDCRHPFETNNGAQFIEEDVSRIKPASLNSLFEDADIRVLAGCAPCQPFSTLTQRYDTVCSPQWSLLYEFGRLAEGFLPDIIVMENVPTVKKHKVYIDFVATLEKLGYKVWYNVVDCPDYGLPQRRRRMVLLASRLGSIELIAPTHNRPVTVREAIGKLPPIKAGESFPADPLHVAPKLSKLSLERIRASRPGGTWRDWPDSLILQCHKRNARLNYSDVYGRMVWDEPAPTLTTKFYGISHGRFGHPEQDRAISLREGAILQGFPFDYSFVPDGVPIQFTTLGRMIGNAVPVTLGKVIGRSIRQHLARKAKGD